MDEINLEESFECLKNILSDGYSYMMIESFLVAMDSQNHNTGSRLKPFEHDENILNNQYIINWVKKIDERIKRTHNNDKQTTDFGAMFISLILLSNLKEIKELIDYDKVCFETSALGTGIDFWLSNTSSPLDFSARIEVSGIRKQNDANNILTRLKDKEKQIVKSDNTDLPAYISIFEFSNIESLIVNK